jgi:hypothetical protein
MKYDRSSWLTKLSSKNTHLASLAYGDTVGASLISRVSRLVWMNAMNWSSKHWLQNYYLLQTMEIITKTVIPPEILLQLKWQIL